MNEYRYSKYLYKPKKKKKKLYIAIFLLILAGGGIFYGLTLDIYKIYSNFTSIYRVWFNDYRFIEKHLDAGDYNVVIHEGTPYLEKRPYNAKLMRYIGEAYYYISKSMTGVEKEESINKAILYIRKGIVLSQFDEAITKNYFLLGMAYFDRGPHYYELAAEYLA